MAFRDLLKIFDLLAFKNAPNRKSLLYVITDDDASYKPVTESMLAGGGSGGGGSAPTVTATYPPQALTVGTTVTPLDVPAGANTATVHVISGSARRNIAGTPSATTPLLSVGDSEEIQGAELAAYRLIRDGSSDAALHIEYRTVG